MLCEPWDTNQKYYLIKNGFKLLVSRLSKIKTILAKLLQGQDNIMSDIHKDIQYYIQLQPGSALLLEDSTKMGLKGLRSNLNWRIPFHTNPLKMPLWFNHFKSTLWYLLPPIVSGLDLGLSCRTNKIWYHLLVFFMFY